MICELSNGQKNLKINCSKEKYHLRLFHALGYGVVAKPVATCCDRALASHGTPDPVLARGSAQNYRN